VHKTIYIDVDEEITGIIDKIRGEGAPDVFLVVPKNAALVQGMLNLKILKKEADKLGKNVMLITADKFARKVIERAGLETAEKPMENDPIEQRSGGAFNPEPMAQRASEESIAELENLAKSVGGKEDRQIGSSSFYEQKAETNFSKNPPSFNHPTEIMSAPKEGNESEDRNPNYSNSEKLRQELFSRNAQAGRSVQVNNSYPLGKTPIPAQPQQQPFRQSMPDHPNQNFQNRQFPAFSPWPALPKRVSISNQDEKSTDLFGVKQDLSRGIKISQGIDLEKGWNNKKAEDFFSHGSQESSHQEARRPEKKKIGGKIFKILVFSLVLLLAVFSAAAYAYWNYPKVKIEIFPSQQLQNADLEIIASAAAENPNFDDLMIPASFEKFEIEKTMEFETTEEKFVSDDGKAKGMITIYNSYSSSPQPLVATTRLLSSEGKLFRLVSAVTIPGMESGAPGQIAASVIADKPGEEYNIGASTFTIEGFKGSSKYEKFQAKSESSMSGGSNNGENKQVKVVTAKDIELARQKTVEQLDKDLEKMVAEKVGTQMKALADTARKEIVSNSSSKNEGDIADSFEYTIKENIEVMAFSEEDVRDFLSTVIEREISSGYVLRDVSKVDYTKSVADFDKGKLSIKVSALGTAVALIDLENLKKGIVGKNETQIQDFLTGYSDLDKAQIKFSPAWLGRLPVSQRKIDIELISEK
jgi:hypothetical protein